MMDGWTDVHSGWTMNGGWMVDERRKERRNLLLRIFHLRFKVSPQYPENMLTEPGGCAP